MEGAGGNIEDFGHLFIVDAQDMDSGLGSLTPGNFVTHTGLTGNLLDTTTAKFFHKAIAATLMQGRQSTPYA
ncbi:MAG: hypothetical protein ABSD38_27245 [Syntrophorhabdales bacterium]